MKFEFSSGYWETASLEQVGGPKRGVPPARCQSGLAEPTAYERGKP